MDALSESLGWSDLDLDLDQDLDIWNVVGRFGEWMLCQRAWAGRIRGNRSETSPLDSWIIYRITAPTSCTLSNVIHLLKCHLSENQAGQVMDFAAIQLWVENLTL